MTGESGSDLLGVPVDPRDDGQEEHPDQQEKGTIMDLFDVDLGEFGAPGFLLRDRIDMTGHQSGQVDPHINSDLVNP